MLNFWVYPPSKPGSQDTLALLMPGAMDTAVTAWGLVPENK